MPRLNTQNYSRFTTCYPQLIEKIRSLNSNSTLVLIGTFNAIKDVRITNEIELPLTEANSLISGLINETIKSYAEKYNAIYVDTTNVETGAFESVYTVSSLLGSDSDTIFHPSKAGYDYIARQILSKLEVEKRDNTDVIVDLGSVDSVKTVVVDGKTVKNYSFDPTTHTLTIPQLLPTAKTLLVTEKEKDGAIYLATYQLTWHCDTGYTAYRLYATRNVVETATNAIKATVSIASKATNLLKGLFS